MNPKLAIRIGTDFAMFAVLFMLMGYSITGNAIHEWRSEEHTSELQSR